MSREERYCSNCARTASQGCYPVDDDYATVMSCRRPPRFGERKFEPIVWLWPDSALLPVGNARTAKRPRYSLKKAFANPDNRPPQVYARDGLRGYPAAIRGPQGEGQVGRPR